MVVKKETIYKDFLFDAFKDWLKFASKDYLKLKLSKDLFPNNGSIATLFLQCTIECVINSCPKINLSREW